MVRSPSFGSYFNDLKAQFKTFLISFSLHLTQLKLATKINSLTHYAKGTLLLL